MVDIRQSLQYANYLNKIGWKTKRIDKTNYFLKKLPFVGSILKIQRPEKINLKTINKLTKKQRTFQIVIEPKKPVEIKYLLANSYKQSKSPFLPTKTIRLNLSNSEIKLFKNLKKDCRYGINKNSKEQLKNSKIKDFEKFRKAWKKAVSLKRYVPPLSHLISLKKSFADNSLFITDKAMNSGAIFISNKDITYYWQAFTNKKGRKNLTQYKIVWQAILWAKKKGVKIFDFEGIYDQRFPNKSWLGFSHFKKSFGGKEVEYPGCFIRCNFFNK